MAKASAPGRTKTRLAPPLTGEQAADFNTACLRDVAANLLSAGADGAIDGYMAYGPTGAEAFFRENMPDGIGFFECWHGDFGLCLAEAARALFERGHAAACLLNADSPTLPTAILVEAADVLSRPGERAVLGPSTDGGYYLLGLNRMQPRLFEEIAWSTEVVAEQTLARAAEIGLPVHILPTWYDVDDAGSLRRLAADLESAPSTAARASRAFLTRLAAEMPLERRLGATSAPEAEGLDAA